MKLASSIMSVLTTALLLTVTACCDKDTGPSPAPVPVTDRQEIRLKEIVIRDSPSPYYAFTYNDSGYVTTLNFASGFCVYAYFYKNQRIDSVITSLTDETRLLYRYTDQKVTSVLQYDLTGLRQTVFIQYDNSNRVTKMEWQPTSSSPDPKITEFEYYDNGNLSRMKSFYPESGVTSTVTYEAYDNQKNVDGFGTYKEFFDHMIFLPAVKFQYNNPTRVKVVTGINEWSIQYNYTYKDSLPTQRNATRQVTAGPSAGQTFTGLTTFSYY